jgi:2-desacetyl-2-hydroxyethyl bacteriochlorophyllide A dehydrogenase
VNRKILYFIAPGQVELREEPIPTLTAGQVLVRTCISAISAGTEMLLYRGQLPADADTLNDTLSNGLQYPTPYGYACVGMVEEMGRSVRSELRDRLVFAFQPHCSYFVADADLLIEVPSGISDEDAAFLPNAETAVNLVQDAAPILGERVLVFGQGVVGLLTSMLLRQFPLACLMSAERYEIRRQASLRIGLDAALDPAQKDFLTRALEVGQSSKNGFDLTVELTGDPSALDNAIALTTFSGRIVIGSWYGGKKALLDLGGKFHRSRIKLLASQVSSISPELSGRWNKARRFEVAWNAIQKLQPSQWITHRFSLEEAVQVYRLLDVSPEQTIQVIFDYP